MGLFQKVTSNDKSKDELPEYVDTLLENTSDSSNEEIDERFSVEGMSLNSQYGIDHAVALMRDLPNENNEVIVKVVSKTLESANINVTNIIQDAKTKEASLDSQIQQLNDEIKNLEAQIAEKKEQINVSKAILDETCKVRQLLETSLPRDTQDKKSTGNKGKQSNDTNKQNAAAAPAQELALEAR